MTGIAEAQAYLDELGEGWFIFRSESELVPGPCVGSPTERIYKVELLNQHRPDHVRLTGTGTTILEATMAAVGVLR